MFDDVFAASEGRWSALEERLRAGLVAVRPLRIDLVEQRRPVLVALEPHGDGRGLLGDAGDAARLIPDVVPEGRALAGLLESGAVRLRWAREAQRVQSRAAAQQARAVAAFAAARPAGALDRPAAEVGAAAAASRAARPAVLTPVSEWAVDEVMVALALSAPAASALLADSVILVEQLPATLDALEAGDLTWAHARMLCEVLAPIADATVRGQVEERVLARAAGKTVSALRAAAKRAVLRADAAAATRRLAAAVRDRSVRVQPGRDGMATLTATLPVPVARACHRMLEAYAQDCAVPGDRRTKDQRMLDCLVDLLLRPDAEGRPPVQAQLTLVAGVATLTGGDEPGEVDGQPIPADLVRALAHALGLLPTPDAADKTVTADNPATSPDAHGDPTDTTTAPDDAHAADATDSAAAPDNTANPDEVHAADGPDAAPATGLADLLNLPSAAGTALTELPRVAIVDELSGQLLALTSPTEIRRAATCAAPACRTGRRPCTHPPSSGLGPPPPTDGYRPSDPLQRFLRARDRRCRFPGCRTPADRCDLDHNTAYPAGATSCDNLCCLCRHHHRLSHQAPGWTMHRLPDGGLEWTTPTGDRVTTHPPRYGTDDNLPPTPTPAPARPRLTLSDRVLGRPPRPGDEPAPF